VVIFIASPEACCEIIGESLLAQQPAGGRLADIPNSRGWLLVCQPSPQVGYELVADGMLIMAAGHDGKPLDYDTLERWTQVGF
jgi:hypothetical protein